MPPPALPPLAILPLFVPPAPPVFPLLSLTPSLPPKTHINSLDRCLHRQSSFLMCLMSADQSQRASSQTRQRGGEKKREREREAGEGGGYRRSSFNGGSINSKLQGRHQHGFHHIISGTTILWPHHCYCYQKHDDDDD